MKLLGWLKKYHYLKQHLVKEAIRQIANYDIDNVDHTKLNRGQQAEYYHNAQTILNNPVFQNEIKNMRNRLMRHATIQNPDHDPKKLRDCNMILLGMEYMKIRLQEIKPPISID